MPLAGDIWTNQKWSCRDDVI